ncbi:MAG: 1-(5-phosphoribosyl)-5-[(5-phosphoribosylamino)methylideneamino]imidazole-4-carboxamide isomerase [Caulobacterales bacterium]
MIIFPAIDLKNGEAVRLMHGKFDEITVYEKDPAVAAKRFHDYGFEWLHVVDLDGAVAGAARNTAPVKAILKATKARVQLGGGVRDMRTIETWLDAGVSRVILGTAAARNPGFVRDAAQFFPGRIAVGIDARDGRVAVSGWVESTDIQAVDLAKKFEDAGVAALIVTDINRDGAKTGINVEFTGSFADAVDIPVIASGGACSVDDVAALRSRRGRRIEGVVMGRALYDGSVDPKAVLKAAKSKAA